MLFNNYGIGKGGMRMANCFTHGYALLIGVGASAYPAWSLPVTVKDAQALRAVLVDPAYCAYADDEQHIRVLCNAAATGAAVCSGLTWLRDQAASDPEATV